VVYCRNQTTTTTTAPLRRRRRHQVALRPAARPAAVATLLRQNPKTTGRGLPARLLVHRNNTDLL